MANDFLRKAYELDTQADTDAYYTEWAQTYDEELIRQGYRTPERCAKALAQFVELDAPILDIGCGTGLSGRALASVGFTEVSGRDVNPEMLDLAKAGRMYRDVGVTNVDDPYPFATGAYAAISAVGVIGVGAAPVGVLPQSLEALATGGHMVFSLNDHAMATPEFVDAVEAALSAGIAEQVFAEDGPHIEGLDLRSTVFVLRRL